jgi:hypothetical protein
VHGGPGLALDQGLEAGQVHYSSFDRLAREGRGVGLGSVALPARDEGVVRDPGENLGRHKRHIVQEIDEPPMEQTPEPSDEFCRGERGLLGAQARLGKRFDTCPHRIERLGLIDELVPIGEPCEESPGLAP